MSVEVNDMRNVLTTGQAAKILGLTQGAVYVLAKKGVIRGEKVGNTYLLEPDSVQAAKKNRPKVGRPKGK